jgi:shikimate kinase
MHLYLIGYRGSGKSTVGRVVAGLLDRPFIDTDVEIERASGMTIKEIFEREGEKGFRDRETAAIQIAATFPDAKNERVISLGGGAILRENNQTIIRSSGRCVYLKASAELLYQRITADHSTISRRPNLSAGGGFDEVVDILNKRSHLYEKLAQKIVSIEGRSPDEIAEEIRSWLTAMD